MKKIISVCCLNILYLAFTCGCAAEGASVLTGKYLMAFHACDTATTSCSNPQNHKVYIVQSNDGASWTALSGYTAYSGSVPDLIRRGNTLYVYTPGRVRRYNIDTDTWEDAVSVKMKQSDGTTEEFVDPSPTLDENGSIVLFYLVGQTGGDPARCLSSQTSCTKYFRSATEVSGSNGASFVVDSGNRAEVTITSSGSASDPDIFQGPDGFILYISKDGGVMATQAGELRGSYQNISGLSNGMLSSGSGSVPSGYYDEASAKYWTYLHTSQGSIAVIKRAVHSSINTSIPDSSFSTIISGSSYSGLGSSYTVESPGFAVNTTNMCAATLSGSLKLHVPVLTLNGQAYWADFHYDTNTSNFILSNYGAITSADNFSSCSAATLSSELKLHIYSVIYNDISYWADLQYSQGVGFALTGAGAN